MPPLPPRGDVLRCLLDAGRALHARELATQLGVREASYPRLLEQLDHLALDGSVRRLPGSRFRAAAAAARAPTWEGTLTVNPRGFGFVAAAGKDDVYIAPDGIGGALHGDRVEVSEIARTSRGAEGRIERVVARRSPRIAGVLRRRGKSTWLEPDDARVRGPITVRLAAGDALASAANDGVAAVVTITRYPELADEHPEADLVAVLGRPGEPGPEVAKILLRECLEEEHSVEARAEAVRLVAKGLPESADGRVDLTDVPLPTIDPEDARDHDDAVWVVRLPRGYRAWIAIADVSEMVTPGSALDIEAQARGMSVYLPDRAIPMLPRELSAVACSLLPDADRLCVCVIADLDRSAKVTSFEIVEGVMRSAAKLTYGGVARALGFDPAAPDEAAADRLRPDLAVVDELAQKLRRGRLRRGALDLDLPQPRVRLDPATGMPTAVEKQATTPGMRRAYQLVEELMLLANELVARFLAERGAPAIHRVHATPDEQKLQRLAEVCLTLGTPCELDELLEPKGLSAWLASLADHPRRPVLELLTLRSLKQAAYDVTDIGHFGLASPAYLHFTSPIRRYPDLEVHRAVKALLRGQKPDSSPAALEALRAKAAAMSARERVVADIEREITDLYRAIFMRDHLGEVFTGIVSGITQSGVFVNLPDPYVDVLVRHESLGPDHYETAEDELSVVGLRSGDTIALGDPLTVEIEDVTLSRRTILGRRLPPKGILKGSSRRPESRERSGGAPAKGKRPALARPAAKATAAGRERRAAKPAPAARGRAIPKATGARPAGKTKTSPAGKSKSGRRR